MNQQGNGHRRTIALLIQQGTGQYQKALRRGISLFAASRGLDLWILDGGSFLAQTPEDRALNRIYGLASSARIDGIISVINTRTEAGRDLLAEFSRIAPDRPWVNMIAQVPDLPCVVADNRTGILEAVGHLARVHGKERIAFLRGPETSFEAEQRFEAFKEALAAHGLQFDPSLAFPGDFDASSGRTLAEALHRGVIPSFDALVTANDEMAIGFQAAAERRGIHIPEDVALVGFDDTKAAVLLPKPLSTIHQPYSRMCDAAGEALLALMDGKPVPEAQELEARFIVRESCGCLPDSRIKRFETWSPGLASSLQPDERAVLPHTEELLGILRSEIQGSAIEGTFCAALNDILGSLAQDKAMLIGWSKALMSMLEEPDERAEDRNYTSIKESVLQEGQLLIAHMLERKYASDVISLKKSLVVMNEFSRVTSAVHTPDNLADALDKALPAIRINYAAISLFEGAAGGEALPDHSSLRYLYNASSAEGSQTEPISFDTLSILPEPALPAGNPMVCTIMPLADSGTPLGFLFFDSSHPDTSIYELFRSQISANLGKAKLLQALMEKETRERIEIEKMTALGTLVAGIAHEINTPIGICVTAASHLERILADLQSSFSSGQVTRSGMEAFIADGAQTGRLLTSNLTRSSSLISSFKKVAVDSSSEERRFFRVKEYIQDILATLSPRLKHTEIEIAVDCPDNLEIDSYPGAFSQILSNLIVNSLEHGYDKPAKGHIAIRFKLDEDRLVWVYEDDGKGIPRDVLPRIFEPFFTTARATGGSGLGLHIVYNTVTALFSGRISVSSEVSKGVKFTITLPLGKKEIRNAGKS